METQREKLACKQPWSGLMGTVMLVTPAGTSSVTVWNTPMHGAATRKLKSSGLSFVENASGTNWYMSVQLATASSAPTISVNDWYLAGSDTGCSRSKIHRRPSSVLACFVTHINAPASRAGQHTNSPSWVSGLVRALSHHFHCTAFPW